MHVRIFKGRDPDPCYLLDVQSLPSPCDHLSFREFKSVMEGDARRAANGLLADHRKLERIVERYRAAIGSRTCCFLRSSRAGTSWIVCRELRQVASKLRSSKLGSGTP
ncbi:hypothetical protein F2Q70_00035681 [Brassica cretica]|uniref:Uncharacterized protein n=1 Tax=Brassica cretica TaxID=69181 RepID=A0A8S9JR17_BRACR|nr:hypothetical protein F2Q70_00035681 [Brassica cretica]